MTHDAGDEDEADGAPHDEEEDEEEVEERGEFTFPLIVSVLVIIGPVECDERGEQESLLMHRSKG